MDQFVNIEGEILSIDLNNSRLYGIQQIPGVTASEKLKFINVASKEIVNKKRAYESLPELLKPLFEVEVSKILNDTSYLAQALQTSDALLCHRALQVDNFFSDEQCPFLDWKYFNEELLDKISAATRCKLIKKISQDLTKYDPQFAETFYVEISKKYGKKQANYLLPACSETFLKKLISKNDYKIPEFIIKKLFLVHPNFVIIYLSQNCNKRMIEGQKLTIDLRDYENFLPQLVDDHFDILIDFIKKNPQLRLKFGKRRTKKFLKKGLQLLLSNPDKYLWMLSLEIISHHLKPDEFSILLSKLLPEKMSHFNYNHIESYLKYFSEIKKVTITQNAFNLAYKANILDQIDLLNPNFLAILSTDQRIRIAKLKLKTENDWNLLQYKKSWRVYLTIENIFEEIKKQSSNSSSAKDRERFICLLIYSCKINKDKDGLLKVLSYFLTRHNNEKINIIDNVLSFIQKNFNMVELDQSHWDILMEMIQKVIGMSCNKNVVSPGMHNICTLIQEGIKFKFKNNMKADDYMQLFLKINYLPWTKFNIFLESNLEYEKRSLEKFLDLIENSYAEGNVCDNYKAVTLLLESIDAFNDRVKSEDAKWKTSKNEIKKSKHSISVIDINNYQKFINFIETRVLDVIPNNLKNIIERYILKHNSELFTKWFPGKILDKKVCVTKNNLEQSFLKKNYKHILDNWEEYSQLVLKRTIFDTSMIRFLKSIRWYQDLPIKLVNEASKLKGIDLFDSFILLGILLDGGKYEKLIDFSLPSNMNDDEEIIAKLESKLDDCIFGIKQTNPPISLLLIQRFFTSKFLQKSEKGLLNTAYRHPISNVMNFVYSIMNSKVSIAKLMIKLVCMVAPNEEKIKFFEMFITIKNLHPSIYNFILNMVWMLFNKECNEDTWILLQKLLQKNIEDPKILTKLSCLPEYPNEFTGHYVIKILELFESINIVGYPDLSTKLIHDTFNQLNEDFVEMLPIEFQNELIQRYLFDSAFNLKMPSLPLNFIFNVYLKNDKTMNKTNFFSNALVKFSTEQFGKSVKTADNETLYPANRLINEIVVWLISSLKNQNLDVKFFDVMQNLFHSVIKPYQDIQSYLFLSWIEEFKIKDRPQEFSTLITAKDFGTIYAKNMDKWVELLGSECFAYLTNKVKYFINCLYGKSQNLLNFVEGLLEVQNNNSFICATLIVCELNYKQCCPIIEKLRKVDIPMVQALLYEYIHLT